MNKEQNKNKAEQDHPYSADWKLIKAIGFYLLEWNNVTLTGQLVLVPNLLKILFLCLFYIYMSNGFSSTLQEMCVCVCIYMGAELNYKDIVRFEQFGEFLHENTIVL